MNTELNMQADLKAAIKIKRQPRVIIVGAGMSRLLSVSMLRPATISDITILDDEFVKLIVLP